MILIIQVSLRFWQNCCPSLSPKDSVLLLTPDSHQNRLNQLWNKDWSNYWNTQTAVINIDSLNRNTTSVGHFDKAAKLFVRHRAGHLSWLSDVNDTCFQQVMVFVDPIRHRSLMPFPERKFHLLTFFWSPFQPYSSLLNIGIVWKTAQCCCWLYSHEDLNYSVLVNYEVLLHCMLNW